MPIAHDELVRLLKAAFPDAVIALEDLRGDSDHWHVTIESEAFRGLSRLNQHRRVHAALEGRVGGVLHALALTTRVPAE